MKLPSLGDLFRSKYRLDEFLGEGGFATVYRATDISLGRVVAVKVLRPVSGGYARGLESRFMREANLIANLSDPHTVTMFDYGRSEEGLLYMVFEHLSGRDLSELLHEAGRLPEAATVHILRQLLLSLREAHGIGILHRDVKPENVRVFEFMGDPIRAKLLDFGIAKPIVADGGYAITTTGIVVGTAKYMSPEHLFGEPLTPSSDLYSLGLVAYEMLMGRTALAEGNSPAKRLRRLSAGPLRLPLDSSVTPAVRATIDRLLELAPKDRFASAEAVIAALDGALVQRVDLSGDYALDDTAAPFVPPPRHLPVPAERAPVPSPSEPPTGSSNGVVAVVLLAVVLAVAGGLLVSSEDPLPSPSERQVPRRVEAAPAEPSQPDREVEAADAGRMLGIIVKSASHKVAKRVFEATVGCRAKPRRPENGLLGSAPWVYLPERYTPGRPYGVVLLLHDDNQIPDTFAKQTKFKAIADKYDLVLIAPADEPDVLEQVSYHKAWQDRGDIEGIIASFETMATRLCLDRSRVFGVGHGSGGRALEKVVCLFPLAAMATTSARGGVNAPICKHHQRAAKRLGLPPVPLIQIAGNKDRYNPVEGGESCSLRRHSKGSLAEKERAWSKRNSCSKKKSVRKQKGGTCTEWQDCEARFVSCRVDGGREWPDAPVPPMMEASCVGPNNSFPFAQTIADFFLAVSK